ncbi:MAG: 4-hydroxy-3-methylbut-2-enyl diphosphate reductase [Jatrophihabitans sp.]
MRASTGTKRVVLAKPRGFCAGVERAVKTVESALAQHGAPVYVRKQIVHNTQVVDRLARLGAVFVDEVDEVPVGGVVVFSAHGVAPVIHSDAADRELRTIDATCPLVSKVHNEARRLAARGFDILLIGHRDHEEVVGTSGEAPMHVQLVQDVEAVETVQVRDPERVAWLSQTTLSVSETQLMVAALRKRFPKLLDPPSDDICYATQNRQTAVRQIVEDVDLMIVVGSTNSSNSQRLVDVAYESGAGAAHLVDDASQVRPEWFHGVATVGVSSGASVPEELVQGVIDLLATHCYNDVAEVEAVREQITFVLPPEVRGLRESV